MKKIYPLFPAILLAAWADAQITIGLAEMPQANDELVRVQAVTNPFVNFGATGPAFTWNFTNLQANTGDTTNYQTVASTNFVYAIVYSDLFFNPNRANHAKPGVDIAFSQLLPIDNPYTFRNRSSSAYKTVGYGVELSGIPVPIIFTQQDVIYELPLQYGDISTSTSAYSIDVPQLGSYHFEQVRTNEVDGWGAITTPGGVFDVLRVKTTLNVRDSISGFVIDRPIAREYKWLAQGLRVPVLQINTTTLFGLEVVNAIYYYDVPRSIEVVAPLASSFCPGAELDVYYEATGGFNAGGFFVPANQFSAELSDANGSFAAPVTIGAITGTLSGVIPATIPANTPPGTNYRIRVISTSPDFTGSSNDIPITVGGVPVASITAEGPTQICTGDILTLTAVGGPGYQWMRDGDPIDGANGATYEAAEAGVYSVMVDNACGSATSNTIAVEVNQPPTLTVDATNFLVCTGSTIDLSVNVSGDQTDLAYQWLLNDAPIPGANGTMVTTSLGGLYTMQASNTITGCSAISGGITVVLESIAAPATTPDGATSFCAGGSVTLGLVDAGNATYQWYQDDNAIDGATGTMLLVDGSGAYTVVATSASGCASPASAAIVVSVQPVPGTPDIVATEPLTFCEGGSTFLLTDALVDIDFQWFADGDPIPGATLPQLSTSSPGDYVVTITTDGGCTATSAAVTVVVNSLPPIPVITLSNDSLTTSGGAAYQWYLNGVAIDGATDSTWVPDENGNYTVLITDGNGCSRISEPWPYLSTGMSSMENVGMTVMPNPSNGQFVILAAAAGVRYEVVDVTGKLVRAGLLNDVRTYVDLHDAPQGLYFVRILDMGRSTRRVIIAR